MLILVDDKESYVDKEFLKFKERWYEEFLIANNRDGAKAIYLLKLAYRALKKVKEE